MTRTGSEADEDELVLSLPRPSLAATPGPGAAGGRKRSVPAEHKPGPCLSSPGLWLSGHVLLQESGGPLPAPPSRPRFPGGPVSGAQMLLLQPLLPSCWEPLAPSSWPAAGVATPFTPGQALPASPMFYDPC